MELLILFLVSNVIIGSFGILLNDLSVADLQQMKSEWKAEILKELDMNLPGKIDDVIRGNFTRRVIAEVCNQLTADTHVAFMAGLSHDIVNPASGTHVIFDQTKINAGSGYNPRHGVFTAQVSGLYMFILNMASSPSTSAKMLHVNIMVKDTAVGYIFLDSNTKYWLRRSDTAIVHLDKGDDVWAKVFEITGSPTINGDSALHLHNHFSGFLIGKD